MLPAARSLPCPTTTTDRLLGTGLWVVTGWSFKETTGGASATLELYDGRNAASTLVACINLSAGESTRDLLAGDGLAFKVGVYVHRLTGSIKGAVWAVPGMELDGHGLMRGVTEHWAGDER